MALFRKDDATTNRSGKSKALAYINSDLIDATGNKHKLRGQALFGDTYVEKQLIKAAKAHRDAEQEKLNADADYEMQPFTITVESSVNIVLADDEREDITF